MDRPLPEDCWSPAGTGYSARDPGRTYVAFGNNHVAR
jgi:hypothetical protein